MAGRKIKLRSNWESEETSECRRSLMLGMGYSEEELHRTLIAVVNSWNEYNPGHVHLNQLAERKSKFHWEHQKDQYPRYLNLFMDNVGSMAKGGIWEV